MEIKNHTGFTLLEVLMAALVFAVSAVGAYSTLSSVRGPVVTKENQLAAVVYQKQVLEALYSQVNTNTYYNTCANPCPNFDLEIGSSHQITGIQTGISWPPPFTGNGCNGGTANPSFSYAVSCMDTGSTVPPCSSNNVAHAISLTIEWWDAVNQCCTTSTTTCTP